MESISRFSTNTLSRHPKKEAVESILERALAAADPGLAVSRFIRRQGRTLMIGHQQYSIPETGCIRILGLGKAAHAMVEPLISMLSDLSPDVLVIPKHLPKDLIPGVRYQIGGHPVPDENSLLAGQLASKLVEGLTVNDLLICLISGGGSSLMSAPCPGVTLGDMRQLTSTMLSSGACIDEINILRRHLDRLKGGGLARLAAPARVASLILSDVIGNPLETIASGPTAPDPSTRADAFNVLEKYHVLHDLPASLIQTLKGLPETPKPTDSFFEQVQNVIIGSNQLAAEAALAQAQSEGFQSLSLGNTWQGEARDVSGKLCHLLKHTQSPAPICLIAGGETTVTIKGKGKGGRNQELALAAVRELAGLSNVMLITLATDGEDGPTDAAGAVVTGETLQCGQELGADPDAFLEENDAYRYFETLKDLLQTGPSGTNVNDLMFLFKFLPDA